MYQIQRKAEKEKETGKGNERKEKETESREDNDSRRDSYYKETPKEIYPKEMPVNILNPSANDELKEQSTKTEDSGEYSEKEEGNESIIDYNDKQELNKVPANNLDGSVNGDNEEQSTEELFRKEDEQRMGIKFEVN